MDYRIVIVNEQNFNDDLWQEYYNLLFELKQRYRSSYHSSSWEDLKQRTLSRRRVNRYCSSTVIIGGDKIVGWTCFNIRNEGTSDQSTWVAYDILPEKIPSSIITVITKWAYDHLCQHKAEYMYHMAVNNRYAEIDRLWGGKQFSCSKEYILRREGVSRATIEDWLTKIPAANPQLHLEFYDDIPKNSLDSYVALLEESIRDIPEEEESGMPFRFNIEEYRRHQKWMQKNSIKEYLAILMDQDGRVVGDTEVVVNLKTPEMVDQQITMVSRDHRECGLAKWLKAAMIVELEQLNPEYERIVTWMRTINEPIQHINSSLGFTSDRIAREFKITRKSLEEYLESCS